MPAYNFKQQFAEAVESGEKFSTIRPYRKDGKDPQEGQMAYLYTGMRTANCRKLGEGTIADVKTIAITTQGSLQVDGDLVMPIGRKIIALADGFDDYQQFVDFFDNQYGLPFHGLHISWDKH